MPGAAGSPPLPFPSHPIFSLSSTIPPPCDPSSAAADINGGSDEIVGEDDVDDAYFSPDEDQLSTTPLRLLQAIDLYAARLQRDGGDGSGALALPGGIQGLRLDEVEVRCCSVVHSFEGRGWRAACCYDMQFMEQWCNDKLLFRAPTTAVGPGRAAGRCGGVLAGGSWRWVLSIKCSLLQSCFSLAPSASAFSQVAALAAFNRSLSSINCMRVRINK